MDCIFCKIVEGTIPSSKLYEDDEILAFRDIHPVAPVHLLIIPKKHIPSMNDAVGGDWPLIGRMHQAAVRLARELGIAESGYRLINNCGRDAGQEVFHIHYHLIGGGKLGPLGGNPV